MSLRLRLILTTGLALLLGLALVGAVTFTLVTRSQAKQVDDTLQAAHGPIEELAKGDPANWSLIPQIGPRSLRRHPRHRRPDPIRDRGPVRR